MEQSPLYSNPVAPSPQAASPTPPKKLVNYLAWLALGLIILGFFTQQAWLIIPSIAGVVLFRVVSLIKNNLSRYKYASPIIRVFMMMVAIAGALFILMIGFFLLAMVALASSGV